VSAATPRRPDRLGISLFERFARRGFEEAFGESRCVDSVSNTDIEGEAAPKLVSDA